jgi:predicted permease
MRSGLIGVQAALAVVLLAAGLLFGRTLWNLGNQDLGLSLDAQVLQVTLLRERGYRPEAGVVLPRLLQRLEAIPGVASATAVADGTLSSGGSGVYGLEFPGSARLDPDEARSRADWVGPNYFRTVGIPLLSGRDLSLADTGDVPRVAIVNEAFARRYFGTAAAAGRGFTWNNRSHEIVGIAKDAKYGDLRGAAEPRIYFSLLQFGPPQRLEIRTSGVDPGTITGAVRVAVREIDPRQSVGEVTTMGERLGQALARERLLADLSSFFGVVTVLLVAVGVYGTVAFSAATRSREIGLRLALGASRRVVIWSVLRELSAPIAIGLALGLAAVVAGGRVVTALLFGLGPTDAGVLAGAALGLLAVAFAAGLVPAVRASRLDPARVLRD